MNLIVDIGNTRTKYAVFDEGDWVECGLGLPEVYDLATSYRKNGKAVNLILSEYGCHLGGGSGKIAGGFYFLL